MDSINWDDFACDNDVLTQDEFEKMLQDTNEFAPMEGYETQPMDTSGSASQGGNSIQPAEPTTAEYASLLVDQFLTQEQLSALAAPPANAIPYFSLEEINQIFNQPRELGQGQFNIPNTQPMDMTDYFQQAQTFPEGGDISRDCFGAIQFTSPMAQNLDQIATEPNSYQNTFGGFFQENIFDGSAAVDPNMYSSAVDPAYIYNYPIETIADQDPLYQAQAQSAQQNSMFGNSALSEGLFDAPAAAPFAPQVAPLEENLDFQFDDSELFGEDEIAAPPQSQLFLPARAIAPTRRRKSRRALPAPAGEAGPSTPIQANRGPLVEISPLKCAGQIKVVNEIREPSGRRVTLPYKYTVYKPLRQWGRIKYNARGYLHETIRFDTKEINDFLSSKFAPCFNIPD